jgi:hypothetical protein
MTDDTKRTKRRRRRSVAKAADTPEFKHRAKSLASALGGYENLNPAQRWLCRAAAQLSLELEAMEGKRAAGEEIDLREYGMLTDRLGRLTERLGLQPESQKPASGIEFVVTVEVDEHGNEIVPVPPPLIDVTPEQIEPRREELSAIPDNSCEADPTPRPLTSDERLAAHDAKKAAWLANERAKAAQRPASPWTSFLTPDGEIMNPGPRITDWSDRRR